MKMFRTFKKTPSARIDSSTSRASEFARLTEAGASAADALRILFDMVTTNGPVPEIWTQENDRTS